MTSGPIPNAIPDQPIPASWGNDIRDRVVQQYADRAQMEADAANVPIGTTARTVNTGTLWRRKDTAYGSWTQEYPPVASGAEVLLAATTGHLQQAKSQWPLQPPSSPGLYIVTLHADVDPARSGWGALYATIRDIASSRTATPITPTQAFESGAAGQQVRWTLGFQWAITYCDETDYPTAGVRPPGWFPWRDTLYLEMNTFGQPAQPLQLRDMKVLAVALARL